MLRSAVLSHLMFSSLLSILETCLITNTTKLKPYLINRCFIDTLPKIPQKKLCCPVEQSKASESNVLGVKA